MALVVALAETCQELPELVVRATGTGAGSHDRPGRANVTRVIIGDRAVGGRRIETGLEPAVVLEANVDDLDPRLWPGVLERPAGRGCLGRLAGADRDEEGSSGPVAVGALPDR